MIKINILKKQDKINCIEISGHAKYAKHGYDIVCAAVSSITTTTINGILMFAETIKVTDDLKILKIVVLKNDEITTKLLVNMINLFKELEKQYQKNISIRMEEKDIC